MRVLHGILQSFHFSQPWHVLEPGLKKGLESGVGVYKLDVERCQSSMCVFEKNRLFAFNLGWDTARDLLGLSEGVGDCDVPLPGPVDEW